MDLQNMIESMNEMQAKDRGNYHLTYGGLIKVLKAAPPDAEFDPRIHGIGSWCGSYIEIALYTDENGYFVQDEEFNGDYKEYREWTKTHDHKGDFPRKAGELAALLESLIGKDFIGYRGGNFTIEEYKPLWLEFDGSTCNEDAIIGIDKDLNLIIKKLDDN